MGLALVAASTPLPERSTTLAAVRLGNHQMVVSNILGTNGLQVALFFLGDLVYCGVAVLSSQGRINRRGSRRRLACP